MNKDKIIEKKAQLEEFKEMYKVANEYNPVNTGLNNYSVAKIRKLESELSALESLPSDELYRKVTIKTADDLPKEEGCYFIAKKNFLKSSGLKPMIFTVISKHVWIKEVEYYLLPVPEQTDLREELINFAKWYYDWKEIEVDRSHPAWIIDEYLKSR